MTIREQRCRSRRHTRRGLTLAEAVVCMVIVSVMLVAALNAAGASRFSQRRMGDRSRGMLLAQELMAEIVQQNYAEPVDAVVFGRESSESGGDRTGYDDVDDYDGWNSSPPEFGDGTVIPNLTGWGRSVVVERINPAGLSQVALTETGIKRIKVRVTYNDLLVAELVALRTVAGPEN